MERKTITVYTFAELDTKIQKKVLNHFRENNDCLFLTEELEAELKTLLNEHKIKAVDKPQLNYSLSYCQGDGVCFTGVFEYKSYRISITHTGHYNHSRSVTISMTSAKTGKDASDNTLNAFESLYRDICAKMEKIGYDIIDYDDTTFKENIDANDYLFYKDGDIYTELYTE